MRGRWRAAFLWLDRPLPIPHVTGIGQLSGGSGNTTPLLTDGTRLLFDLNCRSARRCGLLEWSLDLDWAHR